MPREQIPSPQTRPRDMASGAVVTSLFTNFHQFFLTWSTWYLGRIRDVKDVNRKTAYIVLSEKVSVRALTIAQRIHIMTVGLKDRSEMVQQACGQLLRAWLRSYDHNVIKLLEALDTEGSLECSKMVLEFLFKGIVCRNSALFCSIKVSQDSSEKQLIRSFTLNMQSCSRHFYQKDLITDCALATFRRIFSKQMQTRCQC